MCTVRIKRILLSTYRLTEGVAYIGHGMTYNIDTVLVIFYTYIILETESSR